jgi:cell cycle serine/threonine-protein kinase CDC5/MSD2
MPLFSVKLGNIFLDEHNHVKLGDFGLALDIIRDVETRRSFCGTSHYIAPEIVRKEIYSYEVDVWSLGIMVYAMLMGKFPFEAK